MIAFYIMFVISLICIAVAISYNKNRFVVFATCFIILGGTILTMALVGEEAVQRVKSDTALTVAKETTDVLNQKILENKMKIDTIMTIQGKDTIYTYEVIWK